MADEEGKQGDLKYYQNQPYDMEVDLNNDDEGEDNENQTQKKAKKENSDEQPEQEDVNYNEVSAPKIKDLPKFDL